MIALCQIQLVLGTGCPASDKNRHQVMEKVPGNDKRKIKENSVNERGIGNSANLERVIKAGFSGDITLEQRPE